MGGYKIKEASSGDKHCDYNDYIKRARYFHGMLMTDRDFKEEQLYHNRKRKLLNQTLHGWGVVCGLKVKPTTTPGPNIVVEPGLALDCHGNEILVCEAQTIDPCVKPSPHAEVQAGLCDAYKIDAQPHTDPTLYVMIKYKERITDPVPVYAPGGSCEEKVCDYSRTQEGYCLQNQMEFVRTHFPVRILTAVLIRTIYFWQLSVVDLDLMELLDGGSQR
jgi:hypothetical protein